jgi:hypothetical protein
MEFVGTVIQSAQVVLERQIAFEHCNYISDGLVDLFGDPIVTSVMCLVSS